MSSPAIAHLTDLTGEDASAFHHACALAAASGAPLVTIHGNGGAIDATRLPDAASLAASWGRPIVHHRRCHECCDDVTDTLLDALRMVEPRLVVAGTHARRGLTGLLAGSVAEAVARNLAAPMLIVPNHVRGFVDAATGAIDLRRILVPVGDDADDKVGVTSARALAALAGVPAPEIIRLHVDSARIVDRIVSDARRLEVSLIVMSTLGHDGLVDVLLGSRTEQVLREAGCPLLSLPGHP